MFFGTNLQFLRRRSGITQETLAQQIGVSRQTVSKWESGEATPELNKLMELADIFACKLDALLREDLSIQALPVRILHVKGFRMARYVMISPHAETDVCTYMDNWAASSGLLTQPDYVPKQISWGFPYVSPEQKKRFGLRGHAAAYILPDGFVPIEEGPEITQQEDSTYAVLTLPEPDGRSSHRISQAIQTILEFLRNANIPKSAREGLLPCFEYRYKKDGTSYVDIFLQCRETTATEVFSL